MTLVVGVEISDSQLARTVGTGFDHVPELLDAAGIGYVALGADRATGTAESLSPAIVGTLFARHSHRLGIVAAASPQRDHPYNIARRLASLDHIAHGRAGWLALREDRATTLGQAERGSWNRQRSLGAVQLADAVTATRALWRTWPIETLTGTADLPVRYADHTGVYPTTGPLNVPTTPQGEPVVWWRYERGDDPALLAVADVVTATLDEIAAARAGLPESVHLHVRLDAGPALADVDRATLTELAARPDIHGVLIRLDLSAAADFVERTLPALADAGLVRLRESDATATLRAHLGIARRAEPDLNRHRPVFVAS
ncbi:LLM class flavin-dependent oxidoreductase [Nocardia alba]|uniref:Alkanesulfonate monooxygenase SsuD/methylene tetrahydromethanopterin reductase-like flavin-dependent oxidoreductase (Luciferase family) n=1 Tax=Nocardia alba TaxID=225051 RepID=A0A4R1FQ19_9NOCA|nr:LLM class flavin-dependent oxidoreductase [Nocardia alba]TCJ95624.1 alkanesulfonate monooxygenase SsuD/methylene tetrahydromethanopterin reductase-like flavin-dependent oxidoreductase (luciferase family) [Nocardia alba]